MNTSGQVTEFPVTIPNYSASSPFIMGSDGNFWFTDWVDNQVVRFTPSGTFTEFPIPSPSSGARVLD